MTPADWNRITELLLELAKKLPVHEMPTRSEMAEADETDRHILAGWIDATKRASREDGSVERG